MVTYSRDEIISASEMARGFSAVLKDIMTQTKERLAISKNNKLEAVVLPIAEYERLQEAYDLLQQGGDQTIFMDNVREANALFEEAL